MVELDNVHHLRGPEWKVVSDLFGQFQVLGGLGFPVIEVLKHQGVEFEGLDSLIADFLIGLNRVVRRLGCPLQR